MTLLYINACVRKNSRTNILAKYLILKYNLEIEEVVLNDENIDGLNSETLKKRDDLIVKQEFSNPMFKYARQFVNADIIVVASPFWDLSFPAKLKAYFEQINVNGITFYYTKEGIPKTLCKAKKLIYVTTAGGKIINDDFGFGYVKAISKVFYGIEDTRYFKAQGLDIIGNNEQEILEAVKKEIDEQMKNDENLSLKL